MFRKVFSLVIVSIATAAIFAVTVNAQDLPRPQVKFLGTEKIEQNGRAATAYRFEIVNRKDFDDELFFPAPVLGPCGKNTSPSRTWVNIYNESGRRLYGYCAIKTNAELVTLGFIIPDGSPAPVKILVEFVDRAAGMVSRSKMIALSN